MLDSVKVLCPHCKKFGAHSLSFIQGQIKRMKMDKSYEAAQQMADKSGPFYNKWLAAMEARGEQKRCVDCPSHHANDLGLPRNYCILRMKVVNPAWYSCKFAPFYRG